MTPEEQAEAMAIEAVGKAVPGRIKVAKQREELYTLIVASATVYKAFMVYEDGTIKEYVFKDSE